MGNTFVIVDTNQLWLQDYMPVVILLGVITESLCATFFQPALKSSDFLYLIIQWKKT